MKSYLVLAGKLALRIAGIAVVALVTGLVNAPGYLGGQSWGPDPIVLALPLPFAAVSVVAWTFGDEVGPARHATLLATAVAAFVPARAQLLAWPPLEDMYLCQRYSWAVCESRCSAGPHLHAVAFGVGAWAVFALLEPVLVRLGPDQTVRPAPVRVAVGVALVWASGALLAAFSDLDLASPGAPSTRYVVLTALAGVACLYDVSRAPERLHAGVVLLGTSAMMGWTLQAARMIHFAYDV